MTKKEFFSKFSKLENYVFSEPLIIWLAMDSDGIFNFYSTEPQVDKERQNFEGKFFKSLDDTYNYNFVKDLDIKPGEKIKLKIEKVV